MGYEMYTDEFFWSGKSITEVGEIAEEHAERLMDEVGMSEEEAWDEVKEEIMTELQERER